MVMNKTSDFSDDNVRKIFQALMEVGALVMFA